MIKVNQRYFELIEDYREYFDEELFVSRYSDILDKYDFVVGDPGYDQLRLKRFYKNSSKKAEIPRRFLTIQDYVLKYCDFGCPYFIVRHIDEDERLELISVDEVEDKLHDVKIKPTMRIAQFTEEKNNK